MPNRHLVAGVLISACSLHAQAGVTLTELTEIAKARASADRSVVGEMLEPFLESFAKNRAVHAVEIDRSIAEVHKLGDSVIPLLLDRLEPQKDDKAAQNIATNSQIALNGMELANFADTLIEIVEGDNQTGVRLAIPLLGRTDDPRAGAFLAARLDLFDPAQHANAIRALTQLEHRGAILKIVKGMPYAETATDALAANYLREIGSDQVVPEILRVLTEVTTAARIMRYCEVLAACSRQNVDSARALVAALNRRYLEVSQQQQIVTFLATVAPRGDRSSIARLRVVVEENRTPSLALQAALTLGDLGDKMGPDLLKKELTRELNRKRTEYLNWSKLGDYYFAFGDFKSAAKNYAGATQRAQAKLVRERLYLDVARSEARRPNRQKEVRTALRLSEASLDRLLRAASEDPELAKAYEHSTVKRFLNTLR